MKANALLIASVICLFSHTVHAITLDTALKTARGNSIEVREALANLHSSSATAAGVEAAFDTTVFAKAQQAKDKSEMNSVQAGEWREANENSLGLRKMLPTGTITQLTYSQERSYTEFPPATPASTLPDGTVIPASDPSAYSTYNPAYTTKLELSITQPLWRNFWSREIDLQKSIAEGGRVAPYYTRYIQQQVVQAQTEQLYWTSLQLAMQIKLTKKLIGKQKTFHKLMKRRKTLGRADQVDVATAAAGIVGREGQLLNLEIAEKETNRKLAFLLNPTNPDNAPKISGKLSDSPLKSIPSNQQTAYRQALSNRYDMKLLGASRTPLIAKRDLAREKRKPQLNLFGVASTSGMDEELSEANKKAQEQEHITYAVGLTLEVSIGASDSRSELSSASWQITATDNKIAALKRDIHQEIDLAYQAQEASFKSRRQSEKHIKSLRRQQYAEAKKVKQARSEEIAVLRYEIEALNAESQKITAMYNSRIAEARIRLATHSYPVEK